MPRKITEEVQRQRKVLRQRVAWILDHIFGGKQRRMSTAMEMNQAYLSRVLNGHQGIGPEFLNSLTKLPGVNPDWVVRGEGEPLLLPTRGSLPLAVGILPGWPERYAELLTGERHPVAEAHDRASRYWFKVEANCPALREVSLALLPGDLLLFDANTALWLDRLDQLVGRLFGLRLRRGQHLSYVLGLLSKDEIGFVFDLFGEIIRQAVVLTPPKPEKKAAKEAVHAKYERLPRKIIRLKPVSDEGAVEPPEKPPQAEPATPAIPATALLEFTPEDVVALRVYTVRP